MSFSWQSRKCVRSATTCARTGRRCCSRPPSRAAWSAWRATRCTTPCACSTAPRARPATSSRNTSGTHPHPHPHPHPRTRCTHYKLSSHLTLEPQRSELEQNICRSRERTGCVSVERSPIELLPRSSRLNVASLSGSIKNLETSCARKSVIKSL